MFLMDKPTMTTILTITQTILLDYFFYSPECLDPFLKYFSDFTVSEYINVYNDSDYSFKMEIKYDWEARKEFTSYLMSHGIHRSLVDILHFTDEELKAFENLIPKCTGVHHDFKQIIERAHH